MLGIDWLLSREWILGLSSRAVFNVTDWERQPLYLTVVKQLGQPSLTVTIDRAKIARYGLNVADVNGLIEAAVGGTAP